MSERGLKPFPWAKRARVSEGSLRNFLNGLSQSLNFATVKKLADAENVSISALIGEDYEPEKVPVLNYIGAGHRVFPIDDYPQGGGMYHVDAPEGEDPQGLVALEIRGDSMRPLKNGWVVMYRKRESGVESECLGQLCVVGLTDGSVYVKELQRGYEPGSYNLTSWNADPVENAQVQWAAKVIWIKQR